MGDDRSNDRDGEGMREHGHPEHSEPQGNEPGTAGPMSREALDANGNRVRAILKARVGEEKFNSWFKSMEFASFDGRVLLVTVPVKFLKSWIQQHYADTLLECCATQFEGVEQIEVAQREPTVARKQPRAPDPRPRSRGPGALRRRGAPAHRFAASRRRRWRPLGG